MGFYIDPAFFILLLPIVGVAVILGVMERPLGGWGLVSSLAMLALMFSKSMPSLVFFVGYIILSMSLEAFVLKLFGGAFGKPAPPRKHGEEPEQHPNAVALYRMALAAQIAPLAVYKVGVVFEPDFLGFLGISYITFKAVQVLIETRDGLIDHLTPWHYLYFLSFFPSFTSGPILRSRPFVEDMEAHLTRTAYLDKLYRGLGWFVLGAVYKFVAAPVAQWVMWFGPSAIGTATPGAFALTQLVYGFGYGLDLFFDFAGYSAMAMGVGLALGVEVPRNFQAPFLSIDIKDFWNRWHMSLSWWLRDFVFMRFTSAAFRHQLVKSTVTAACIGYVINMVLMGCWHGLTLGYLVYGLYHGLLLAGCELIQRKWGFYKKHKRDRWFKVASWAVTMIAVFIGFALFSGQVFDPVGV